MLQIMPLSGEIFHPGVNSAILDPFANLKSVASSIPEILNEFKICRQTDTAQTLLQTSKQYLPWQVITSKWNSTVTLFRG